MTTACLCHATLFPTCFASVPPRDPVEAAKHHASVAGPTMLFVTLKRVPGWKVAPGASVEDKQRGGWDKDRIADLTSKWRDVRMGGCSLPARSMI